MDHNRCTSFLPTVILCFGLLLCRSTLGQHFGSQAECRQERRHNAEWCPLLDNSLCSAAGGLGKSYRASCAISCGSCEPFEPSMAAALKESLTEEFRTGFVLPDPSLSEVEESSLRGWNTWLQYTNASSVGFPAGDKFILIRHITIEVRYTAEPDCEEYARAARALIDDHKIQVAIITHNNCKTRLSQMYHEAGILHFIQSGTPMTLPDGSLYLNGHSWFIHLDSNEYPQLFLKGLSLKGHRKVALLWCETHPWTKSSSKFIIDSYIDLYAMDLVYTGSWHEGGSSLSGKAGTGDGYVELYNTTAWDVMLQEAADAGASVLVVYCIGEGASIIKRMKTLGISFEGVFMSVSPTRVEWSHLLGTDGDYVVAPAQWSEAVDSKCDVFGSSANYADVYKEYNGRAVDYHAATMTAAGVTLQLAIQTRNSTDPRILRSVVEYLSRDTMFGRIRFSLDQRNFGRPPVGLQHQNGVMSLVYPENMALRAVLPFISWDCRRFLQGQNVCTSDQLGAFSYCSKKYKNHIPLETCQVIEETANKVIATPSPRMPETNSPPITNILAAAATLSICLSASYLVYRYRKQLQARRKEVEAGVLCQALDRTSGRQSANLGSTSQIFASNADRHPDGQLATNSKAGVKDASQALACSAADRDQGMRDLHVEVTGIIGKGGGGVVYRGLWRGVQVALKVCRIPALATNVGGPHDVFTMESGIGEALRHPNVVQIFGSEVLAVTRKKNRGAEDIDGDRSFTECPEEDSVFSAAPAMNDINLDKELVWWEARIIQEFCCHGDLKKALKQAKVDGQTIGEDNKPTPPLFNAAVRLALDAAAGMAYIHSMKVIHGDLKASNILLGNRDLHGEAAIDSCLVAKVSDFGLALLLDNDKTHVSGVFAGTVTHMAPECLVEGRQSLAGDVYAFGILLYELVTARSAYHGRSSIWIIDNVVKMKVRPVLPATTPRPMVELFHACTQHDPAARPTMDEVVQSLTELLAHACDQPVSLPRTGLAGAVTFSNIPTGRHRQGVSTSERPPLARSLSSLSKASGHASQVGSCGSESNYSDNEEDDDSVFVIRMSSMGKESGVHAEQEHQQSG